MPALMVPALMVVCGCSTKRMWVAPKRTARQQVLASEAIDQALRDLAWPPVRERRVRVEVSSIAEARDEDYLRGAVEAALLERGALVVGRRERTDLTVTVLSGVVGIERKDVFLGIPELENVILTVPALSIYKSTLQRGLATVRLAFRDSKSGRLVYAVPPRSGETYVESWNVLFFGKRKTNTSLTDDSW